VGGGAIANMHTRQCVRGFLPVNRNEHRKKPGGSGTATPSEHLKCEEYGPVGKEGNVGPTLQTLGQKEERHELLRGDWGKGIVLFQRLLPNNGRKKPAGRVQAGRKTPSAASAGLKKLKGGPVTKEHRRGSNIEK